MGNSYDAYNQPQEHAPAGFSAVAGFDTPQSSQTSYISQSPRQRAHRETHRTPYTGGGTSVYEAATPPDTDKRLIDFLDGIGLRLGDVRDKETDGVVV